MDNFAYIFQYISNLTFLYSAIVKYSSCVDFIVGFDNEQIIMEVGWTKKDFRQVNETVKKVTAKYKINSTNAS